MHAANVCHAQTKDGEKKKKFTILLNNRSIDFQF